MKNLKKLTGLAPDLGAHEWTSAASERDAGPRQKVSVGPGRGRD